MHKADIEAAPEPKRRRGCGVSAAVAVSLLVLVALLAALGADGTEASGWGWLGGPQPRGPRVGLIAGHWQSDSGAVCSDGLQEVEVNRAIAEATADLLRRDGYRVDVLTEFDPRLDGYEAAALVSIHCDSCESDLSGFKIARLTDSAMPETEDRLVAALYARYAEATGLAPNENTITEAMRQYHAFRRIAPETPAAIIECGFLASDRDLLTQHPDRAARGIADGIITFLTAD
ncbi:MAG: N-acetylmuramoyl-L-alanine amidase [Anaerolineales bacterium]